MYKAVYGNFRVHMDQVMNDLGYIPEGEKLSNKHAANIFFGNYMEPDADPKIYDQVTLNSITYSATFPNESSEVI